jgi:hypothetical protein
MSELQIVAFIALCFVVWSVLSTVVWLNKAASYNRLFKKLIEIEDKIQELEKLKSIDKK